MEKIQRVPLGLLNVVGAIGGQAPSTLADQVIGNFDMLDFYARSQLQTVAIANATLAEGGQIIFPAVGSPARETWNVVVAAEFRVTTTATANGYAGSIRIGSTVNPSVAVASNQLVPGYTVGTPAGDVSLVAWAPSRPFLLPPSWFVVGTLDVLGTDPTAACSLRVAYSQLG